MAVSKIENANKVVDISDNIVLNSSLYESGSVYAHRSGNLIIVRIVNCKVKQSGTNMVLATGLPVPVGETTRGFGYYSGFPTGATPSADNRYSAYVQNGSLYVNVGSDKPTMFMTIPYFA